MAKRGRSGRSPFRPKEGVFERLTYTEDQFSRLSRPQKKEQVLWEQGYRCNFCGDSQWMGRSHKFDLHHKHGKTGVRNPHGRWNLECLCPNCHSQKPGYRGEAKVKARPEDIADTYLRNGGNLLGAFRSHGYSSYGSRSMREAVKREAAGKQWIDDPPA